MHSITFGPEHYNEHLVLKMPFLAGMAAVYLARHILLPLAVVVTSFKRGDSPMNYLFEVEHGFIFILAALPALLVLYAWAKRLPGASLKVQRLWAYGRPLLAASAVLDVILRALLISGWTHGLHIAFTLLDGYVVLYLLMAPRAMQVFKEFPQHDPPPA